MNIKFILKAIILVFPFYILNAQSFNLQNGPFQYDCSSGGVLYDSGGPGSSYGNNENIEMVICPPLASGQGLYLEVNTMNLGDNDTIYLYDGGSTASPLITTIPQAATGASYSTGAVFQTSVDNLEGCMTVVFVSDASGTGDFSFNLLCGVKCQRFTSGSISTPSLVYDEIQDGNYINICLGDTFYVDAFTNYLQNGTTYFQNDATSDFVWSWGDFTDIDTFQTGFHYFENPGGYVTQLSVFDVNGCRNFQDLILKVRVAPEPIFNATWDSVICLGQTANLFGLPEGVFEDGFITGGTEYFIPPFYTGDTTFIPDGGGGFHSSTTFVTGFDNNAVIEDCGTIIELCAQLEHSYSGDLDIVLICPNGQSVNLLSYPTGTGSTNFGEPFASGSVDGVSSDPTPGIPYEYCFSEVNNNFGTLRSTPGVSYTYTTVPSIINGNTYTYTDTHFPAGTYLPEQSFSNLVGCPINGEWELRFTDNLALDNGWLFNWTLDIHPCMYPDIDSFTMVYNTGVWEQTSTIIDYPSQNEIVVRPDTSGVFTYVYTVLDNFGCEYSNSYDVRVRDIYTQAFGDTAVCLGDTVQIGVELMGADLYEPTICTYTIDMQASFGDGWFGSTLTVIIGGVSQTVTFTDAQGSPAGGRRILTYNVPEGVEFTVVYNLNSSPFPTEHYYAIFDNDNNMVFSAGSVPCFGCFQDDGQNPIPDGTTYTTLANCATGNLGTPIFSPVANIADVDTVCDLTLNMFDSFGDGWNGGFLTVFINGNSQGSYSVPTPNGSFATNTFPLTIGDQFSLNYTSGSWESENRYEVVNTFGDVLHSAGPFPQTGNNVFSITMTAENCAIDNFVAFDWQPEATVFDPVISGYTSTVSVAPDNFTSYVVTTTLSNGCVLTDTVEVGFIRFAYELSNDTTICEGESVQLFASGSDSYEWTVNNQTLNNPNISNPIASPIETTAYYVRLDSAGCATIDSVVVNVNQEPQFEINDGVNPVEFCNGSSIWLYATLNEDWNYTWSGPENGQGDSLSVSTAGSYTLLVADNIGCNNSESVTLVAIQNASFNFTELRNILCCTDDEVVFNPEFFVDNGLALSEVYWNGDLVLGDITVISSENAGVQQNVLSTVDENGCTTEVEVDFDTKCAEPEILSLDTVYSSLPTEFNVIYIESEGAYYEFDWTVNSTLSGSFVDPSLQNPIFIPSENEGDYITSVDVSSYYLLNNDEYYLCQEVAEQNFKVIFVNNSKIPDAFTPNGDGINDLFFPVLDQLSTVKEFRIYNRWNHMVYQLGDNSQGWDGNFKGNKQPADLYLYYIEIETPVGAEIFKGSFTLIR